MQAHTSLTKSLSLKLALFFSVLILISSCTSDGGGGSDDTEDGTPLSQTMITQLSADLVTAGYSQAQADAIASGATTLVGTEGLSDSADVTALAPVVLKGALVSLSDADAGISTYDDKMTAIDVIIGCVAQSLNGNLTSSSISKLKSKRDLSSGPNQSSLASVHAAIMKLLSEVAIQQLDEAGISSADMVKAVKQVSKYLVKCLRKAGVVDEDLATVVKSVTTAAVEAVNETGLSTSQTQTAIEAVIIGVINGLSDYGADAATIADIADEVAQSRIVVASHTHFVLFEFIAAEDDDLLRVLLRQQHFGEFLAE